MENKIAIIGSGRVATHLTKAFNEVGVQTYIINSHTLDNLPLKCSLYIIAVSDNAIEEVAHKMRNIDGIVVHCSGATSIDSLSAHSQYGILYPCQTFSLEDNINYADVHFAIEGSSPEVTDRIECLLSPVTSHIHRLNSLQRANLHVAAVIANNFTNHLLSLAHDYMREHKLPFEILRPLMQQTIDKAFTLGAQHSQTGPAIRGDKTTIEKHLSLIDDKGLKEIYQTMTDSIITYHISNI